MHKTMADSQLTYVVHNMGLKKHKQSRGTPGHDKHCYEASRKKGVHSFVNVDTKTGMCNRLR